MADRRLKPRNAKFDTIIDPSRDLILNLIDFTISEKELDTGLKKEEKISITVIKKPVETDSIELF